jgi:hypothetical protein
MDPLVYPNLAPPRSPPSASVGSLSRSPTQSADQSAAIRAPGESDLQRCQLADTP